MTYGRYIRDIPHTAYSEKGKTPVLVPGANEQLSVHSVTLLNRAALPQDMAVMIKHAPTDCRILRYTAAGTVYTDLSDALRAGTATSLISTTNNDGFVIGSKNKFNLIGLNVTQAEAGNPVYAFEYWNGSAWVSCPAVIDTPLYSGTGSVLFVHLAPLGWAPGGFAGAEPLFYYLRIRGTTAPAQAVIANEFWIARMAWYSSNVPQHGILHVAYPYNEPRTLDANESVMPYFSIADAKNCVAAQYISHR